MQQVQKAAQDVEVELRKRAPNVMNAPMAPAAGRAAPMAQQVMSRSFSLERQEAGDVEGGGSAGAPPATSGVRVTGFWMFQTVVVPPNMYVVHTRRGHVKPLDIGLGLSFRYNPYTDAFLVVPSSLQTILISANSICKELQGILVQAYVQWIIQDIEVAYQRLDFSDTEDPMRVVNVQLREQAQAAIKDKVATMSIRDVLSDKQPIIEELTRRLKVVAEGSGDDKGLGIRIVTVQIKEAVVSSKSLWENLQKPFRATQSAAARLAEIEEAAKIAGRELAEREATERAELKTEAELARLRAEKQALDYDRERIEAQRRLKLDQETEAQRIESALATAQAQREAQEREKTHALELEHKLRRTQREKELEEVRHATAMADERYKSEAAEHRARLAKDMVAKETHWRLAEKDAGERTRAEAAAHAARLELAAREEAARNEQAGHELAIEEARRRIANQVSPELVQLEAVKLLPQLAHALPKPDRVETVAIGDGASGSLAGLVASLLAVLRQGTGLGAALAPAATPRAPDGGTGPAA